MVVTKNTTRGFQEVCAGLSRKAALEEARRCLQCHLPTCREACPLGVDIPGFIRLLREGNLNAAAERVREENDLPGICGRVCLAPCEKVCVLQDKGQAIAVRALERFVADHGRGVPHFSRKKRPANGPRIAVVGSGAAGLAAAGTLARQDCQVKIFEAFPYLGGRLRYGVARFRLPEQVLAQEIKRLKGVCVDFETSSLLGASGGVGELLAKGFRIVLLAVGRGRPLDWPVSGHNLGGVFYPEELFIQTNLMNPGNSKTIFKLLAGKKIVVLGKGNTAMDCARTCARLGKEVTWVTDHTLEELGVYPQDREWAVLEGVRFETMIKPVKILADEKSCVCGLLCQRLDYADPESKGEWRLTEVPESDFVMPADAVITVAGREPNSVFLSAHPQFKKEKDKTIWTDANGMTSMKCVFACGEMTMGMTDPVGVMASGKKTAENILEFMKREE